MTGIVTKNGSVDRVITDRGEIRTETLVDAAGVWARLIAETISIRIPMVPTRHQVIVTEPVPGAVAELPILRFRDNGFYMRHDKGGLLFGGYEPNPLQYDMAKAAPNFQMKDLPLDAGALQPIARQMSEYLPMLRDFKVREIRGGLPTMTADGRHIVGPVKALRGFFAATGCALGALTTSPAIGEAVAEWITTGQPPVDMSQQALERFGAEYQSDEKLKDTCLSMYTHHYAAT